MLQIGILVDGRCPKCGSSNIVKDEETECLACNYSYTTPPRYPDMFEVRRSGSGSRPCSVKEFTGVRRRVTKMYK